MAPLPSTPSSRRVSSRGRGRGGRGGTRRSLPLPSPSAVDGATKPIAATTIKKRRYVPGGPGGGGRYIDIDGTEIPVGGTGPGGYAYVGPRGPIGRRNAAKGISPVTPRFHTPRRVPRRERSRRQTTTSAQPKPRYSSAAAAAAAVQSDAFKPREERGWEEYHPDMILDASMPVFSAEEIDGITLPNGSISAQAPSDALSQNVQTTNGTATPNENDHKPCISPSPAIEIGTPRSPSGPDISPNDPNAIIFDPPRRKPGRPFKRSQETPNAIGSPHKPKVVPPPDAQPKEKLTLPTPSFRRTDPFSFFEQKATGQQRYVDRSMANVGYQETDLFLRPATTLIRIAEGTMEEDLDLGPGFRSDGEGNTALGGAGVGRVEYDMDEQDDKWLTAYNEVRKMQEVEPITREVFEITMTKIEKEWHALEKRIPKPNPKPPQTHRPRSSSAAAVNGEPPGAGGEEQDSKCAVCDDGDCENTNAIVFCDGCDLAVHQECYGVPFIPEGQWLCRKCQLIGRSTPTCIFCPNVDGAFKQTNSSRWSHLLCAIWTPEVTLGNPTFMEPVMDVEKVPKQRWKLTCYICRQRMGACIQCGNKQCFVAFHVTCARRARLFLKMKSAHGGPASLDSSILKAFCDKHVPAEWRRDNDVEAATADAQAFYRHTMRGRLWADSQQSALSYAPPQPPAAVDLHQSPGQLVGPRINLAMGGVNNKRKRQLPPASTWKLPSGAPVVPQVVYASVESSLQRFMIRRRKDYAAEACKYWTLKREARRGAALLKRLQLQMETFSSMEITRRNFAGMGVAGRSRLQRRVDFATQLLDDVGKLRDLAEEVRKREKEKLKMAHMLQSLVDSIYFPIAPLLWPILEKAQKLDSKGVFDGGFKEVAVKLSQRSYTSVSSFSADLSSVFRSTINASHVILGGDLPTAVEGTHHTEALTIEQKERRRLAKRIIKAIQPGLADASRKEAELGGKSYTNELRDVGALLDRSVQSRRGSLAGSVEDDSNCVDEQVSTQLLGVARPVIESLAVQEKHDQDQIMGGMEANEGSNVNGTDRSIDAIQSTSTSTVLSPGLLQSARIEQSESRIADAPIRLTPTNGTLQPESFHISVARTTDHAPGLARDGVHPTPPTPPMSSGEEIRAALSHCGIPWYLEPFDPIGTTIHEERWTGREVVRGMSEELSEIDDEELRGLTDMDMANAVGLAEVPLSEGGHETSAFREDRSLRGKNKRGKATRRWRGFK